MPTLEERPASASVNPSPRERGPRAAAVFAHAGHLLGLQGMPAAELRSRLADAWAAHHAITREPEKLARRLQGRVVANLFFEDSTRTRSSFSVAAARTGASVVELIGSSSSVNKGETLIDTARNVASMGVACIITRTRQSGGAANIARGLDEFGPSCPVVNAGDGKHEHPTQGLLDALALAEAHKRLDGFDFSGLNIAIVGDVVSSRVARSNVAALTTLGARVTLVGPAVMAPGSLEGLAPGVRIARGVDEVVAEADAVMMLRIQFERHDAPGADTTKKSAPIASIREYRESFALTQERAARMKPGAVVLHPGPINRGLELDQAVADGPRSVIMRQVELGVAVRASVLVRSVLGAL
jgi:aspartate carbamoyltransferase catalytic subunit